MNFKFSPRKSVTTLACQSVLIAFAAWGAMSANAQENLQHRLRQGVVSSYTVAANDPEAVYEGARVVHNVTVNGEKGMRIHATFRVKYGLGTPCMMIAYYFFDDGKPLKTDEPEYRTKTGTVYSHNNFTPAYDPAVYKDLQIFMPYSALNMESGEEYELKFYLALYDKGGDRFFGKSGWYKFKLTMP